MNDEQIQKIVEKGADAGFCCSGAECEAGHCRARLIRIEEQLDQLIEGTSRSLNSIIEFLKQEKRQCCRCVKVQAVSGFRQKPVLLACCSRWE